jgi:hypothetical protein
MRRRRAAMGRKLKGMYITTRNIAGDTLMTCKDCGHAISMNNICEKPIHGATEMLKHMAAHNASRAFAPVGLMRADPEPIPESLFPLSALQLVDSSPVSDHREYNSVSVAAESS